MTAMFIITDNNRTLQSLTRHSCLLLLRRLDSSLRAGLRYNTSVNQQSWEGPVNQQSWEGPVNQQSWEGLGSV